MLTCQRWAAGWPNLLLPPAVTPVRQGLEVHRWLVKVGPLTLSVPMCVLHVCAWLLAALLSASWPAVTC